MEDCRIFSTESLRRILRIPLQLKCSSWCGGFNGKQRRLTVATGGLGWWKNEVLGFGWHFGEEESEKSCFSRSERIYNLHISLSEPVALSRSPLLWLELGLAHLWALSAIPSLVGIALNAPFSLSERPNVVILKIPTVRLW